MTTDPNAPDAALLWAREKVAYAYTGSEGREDAVMAGIARAAECDELAEAHRAGQSHERRADAGLLAALGAIRFNIAQQRGGALYPNDTDGFEMALDDFDEIARAAINAAKGTDQ